MTNTTKESRDTLLKRLANLGFDINSEEVFTSLTAARRLVEKRRLRPLLLLEQDALSDFQGIPSEDPNAVVVGLAPQCFNYETLNKAFRWILMKNGDFRWKGQGTPSNDPMGMCGPFWVWFSGQFGW